MDYEIAWSCGRCKRGGSVTVSMDCGSGERYSAAVQAHSVASQWTCKKLPDVGQGRAVPRSLTQDEIRVEIARCDREIAAMESQDPVKPAYLTTMGIEDWRKERRILEEMLESWRKPEWSETLIMGRAASAAGPGHGIS